MHFQGQLPVLLLNRLCSKATIITDLQHIIRIKPALFIFRNVDLHQLVRVIAPLRQESVEEELESGPLGTGVCSSLG
jgi:hypothetical protein